MTPGAIADNFDSKRQTISRHIQILAECELLTQEQQGREIIYRFNPTKMKEVNDFIEPFRKLWESRFESLDNLLDNMQPSNNN
ncbi:MAG: hypothetical protein Roseis3KO_22870 [Roseivirga sp.]